MRITVLAGGVGAARFLRGLRAAVRDAEITVIGNTGDDITLYGLRVCPDLDTVMYTLGAGINEEQGWGRADESFTVQRELAAYGAGTDWFALGDRDIATHITRTRMLTGSIPSSSSFPPGPWIRRMSTIMSATVGPSPCRAASISFLTSSTLSGWQR